MGEIKVTVQTEKRLVAINNMSIAIRRLAEALFAGTTVEIKDCAVQDCDTGISVATAEGVTETKIERVTETAE